MTLIVLLYSQLSMVDVRARKSSVMERRTGEQTISKSIESKQSMFDRYRDHWLFGIWGIWYQESFTGHHQLTALTQACFNLGGQNVLEVTTAPSKVLLSFKINIVTKQICQQVKVLQSSMFSDWGDAEHGGGLRHTEDGNAHQSFLRWDKDLIVLEVNIRIL